jgi:hypothetical protein
MITNRYNRSNFYKKVVVDGVEQFDLTTNSIEDFKFSREMTYYKISEDDIARPDLIAVKAYQDRDMMNVWWIIMCVNNKLDMWNDFVIGELLNIPDKKDLEDFLSFNQSR